MIIKFVTCSDNLKIVFYLKGLNSNESVQPFAPMVNEIDIHSTQKYCYINTKITTNILNKRKFYERFKFRL